MEHVKFKWNLQKEVEFGQGEKGQEAAPVWTNECARKQGVFG